MFENLTDRLSQTLRHVTGKAKLTEDNIKDTLREVRMALLEADVALPVVRDFIARVKDKALGAEVTVLSRTDAKKADGLAFGATDYRATEDGTAFSELAGSFDVIINTVGSGIPLDSYMRLLDRGGVLANVGAPTDSLQVSAFSLLANRRRLAGNMIGGLPETQEMLDFCAEHDITATVEVISADQVDDYYDRVVDGGVRYRAVIDASTLGS